MDNGGREDGDRCNRVPPICVISPLPNRPIRCFVVSLTPLVVSLAQKYSYYIYISLFPYPTSLFAIFNPPPSDINPIQTTKERWWPDVDIGVRRVYSNINNSIDIARYATTWKTVWINYGVSNYYHAVKTFQPTVRLVFGTAIIPNPSFILTLGYSLARWWWKEGQENC